MALLRILMTADAVGGVWTYVSELAAALPGHCEILLAVMGPAPTPEQVHSVHPVHVVHRPFDLEWTDNPWPSVEAAADWLLDLARQFQPDVIHLNGYAHAALPWPAPVVVVAHSCVLSWWSAVKGESAPVRYQEYAARVAEGLSAADLIIAPTRAMLEALEEHYAFTTPAEVIPNARCAQLFAPGEKQPIIFSAGRLWDEAKNTALLERLAPQLSWPVHLAGADEVSHCPSKTLGKIENGFEDQDRSLAGTSELPPDEAGPHRRSPEPSAPTALKRIAQPNGLGFSGTGGSPEGAGERGPDAPLGLPLSPAHPARWAGLSTAGLSGLFAPAVLHSEECAERAFEDANVELDAEGGEKELRPIRFLGALTSAEMASHLASASIYAAPARYEPFGLGILEAALAGCALVLSDIPSLRENWTGAALFLPPADETAWRDALNHLAHDAAARTELAQQARARALRFSPAAMAQAYDRAYRELSAAAEPLEALAS